MNKIIPLLLIRLIINLADSLFYIVTIWHISNQPNSSINLGIVISLFTVPEVIIFIFGPIIDSVNPKKLIMTSVLSHIIILICMIKFNIINFSVTFLFLVFIAEVMSSITYGIEDVMIPKLVKKEKIVFVNSLFSISYKVMDFIFNAAVGLLLVHFTTNTLYKIDTFIFLLVFLPLIKLKAPLNKESRENSNYFSELKEGISFATKGKYILPLTLPLIFLNFSVAMTMVAYPYYIRQFDNPELLLALFSFVAGVGSLVGTAIVSSISKKVGVGKIIIIFLILNSFIWGGAFIIGNSWIMLSLIFISYIASSIYNLLYESLFQMLVPEKLLGRVNTLIDSVITFAMPAGSLVGGALLVYISPKVVMLIFSAVLLITAFYYSTNKEIKELPLISEVD